MSIQPSSWFSYSWFTPKTFVAAALAIGSTAIVCKIVSKILNTSDSERSPVPVSRSWLLEMDNPFCPVHWAKNVVKNAKIQPGMSVLDAGCGPGRLTIPIAHRVGTAGLVTALDLQEGMLNRAKEKAEQAKLKNIQFLQAGLGQNRLEPHAYDRAVLVTVLGEIPDQKAALSEIFNALKSDGLLSVTEIIFDPDFLSQRTVVQLATEAGFKEKECLGNRWAYTILFGKA